jgi:hypothetical protein
VVGFRCVLSALDRRRDVNRCVISLHRVDTRRNSPVVAGFESFTQRVLNRHRLVNICRYVSVEQAAGVSACVYFHHSVNND